MAVCDLKLEEKAAEHHIEKTHWQPTDLMALEQQWHHGVNYPMPISHLTCLLNAGEKQP